MENNNFLDRNTILAIVLVGVSWVGWQYYINKKYPPQPKTESNAPATADKTPVETAVVAGTPGKAEALITNEELISVDNEYSTFQISSVGMAVKNFTLKKYTDRDAQAVKIGSAAGLFQLRLYGESQAITFKVIKKSENVFEGQFSRGSMNITEQMEFDPKLGTFRTQVFVKNPDANFKGIEVLLPEEKKEVKSGGFLLPSFEHQEFVVHAKDKLERVAVSATENTDQTFNTVSMAAIGSQYFAAAIVDKSEIIPEAHVLSQADLKNSLIYKPATMKDLIEIKYIGYVGPKSVPFLEKIDSELVGVVNYGFFSSIAKILLNTLLFFQSLVQNWGVAIILLTLLARMLVLPFNLMSYKSMKRMQLIQPKMQALRERYKDDAQAMNRETMALMKDSKVNPLGGCLPMLLQMPIFFALYQVLGQSIELYQAPFFGWIHDLSLKDPFYVLPILMSVAMWFQQKITPTTADPTQAKVLQYMPLVFGFMMISLPSGLTLYIFISTLFAVIQQQVFMKDRKILNVKNEAANA